MQVDLNDKSELGLKIIKFLEKNKKNLIFQDNIIYYYDGNIPNFGKRCNAKGREVELKDILND